MTDSTGKDVQLAADLLDALLPLLGAIHASRTLSPGKVGILRTLREQPRATTTDLAHAIGVSQQAISLAAKELETAGFIERRKDGTDLRKVWFHLTSLGSDKLDSELRVGRAGLEQAIRETLTGVDRKAVQAAIPVLRKISHVTSHVE